ncbi:MAG TPA: wax ester/triacylglycerol synthase family O-acyltransferase [Burkholderiaceae bacterium]|nr:wax ester/triacylglycerol synthase family O-acyltransferase [Burkholderiaceae bacterium]
MSRRPMSPGDAVWFHMDGPVNTAVITSILVTQAPLDFEQVQRVYARRLARFGRFSVRVVEAGLPYPTPHWETMPGFEIGQQLHHIALPAPGGDAALASLVSDLASTPLDPTRPLWDVHVVDGVGTGSALITRMHHCLGDGTANVLIAKTLFDAAPDTALEGAAGESVDEPGAAGPLFAPMLQLVRRSARRVEAAVGATLEAARHPDETLRKAGVALAGAAMLGNELLRTDDPPSPLKGEFGLAKRVAWSAPVALADVKAIGAPLGAKINDVLVAGMTGALRTYLQRRGVDVSRTTVRAMVPVDLRPPEHASQLGNEFGVVLLDLAIGSRQRLQRVLATKANMDALKRSPEPIAALALFGLLGRLPKAVEDIATRMFQSKASVVMTNVAGPHERLHLASVPIERVMFWVPHPGRELGMGISILSYCGEATLAVIADAHLVPDPEAITQEFNREFTAMLKAVRARRERDAAVPLNEPARPHHAAARTAMKTPAKRARSQPRA